MATLESHDDKPVEKTCAGCKRKIYPCRSTIDEVESKFTKKPKFMCPPCARNSYQKGKKRKLEIPEVAVKSLGLPKELLKLMGESYLESGPDGVAS